MTNYKENVGKHHAYYHICNSGISITVDDQEFVREGETAPFYKCPVLTISSSSYGIKMGETKIPLVPNDLRLLGEWLIAESFNVRENYLQGSNDFRLKLIDNENSNLEVWADENGNPIEIDRKDYYGSGSEKMSDSDSDDEKTKNECSDDSDCCGDDCCLSGGEEEGLSESDRVQIRLEALNHAQGVAQNANDLLSTARAIEKYILG